MSRENVKVPLAVDTIVTIFCNNQTQVNPFPTPERISCKKKLDNLNYLFITKLLICVDFCFLPW